MSYVEREYVDGLFIKALETDKQIIVYGASKQGKTSLVEKHLPYKDNITVSLTPKFSLVDIYKSILSSADIRLVTHYEHTKGSVNGVNTGAKVGVTLPLIGGLGSSVSANEGVSNQEVQKEVYIEANLELPNDVVKILDKAGVKKYIILENFHYLDEETQKQFAYDLRSFQDLGLRFIILGVWREKNRLIQFNGDLLDRVFEIPVEPWDKKDFRRVIEKGSNCLNVFFSEEIISAIIQNAFDSIGVVQELLKLVCKNSGIEERQQDQKNLCDVEVLEKVKKEKAQEYAARHLRALEAIAEGRKKTGSHKSDAIEEMPLYLPYYTVRSMLEFRFDDIVSGISRSKLEAKIKEIHHRPENVRASDMSNLLYNLAKLQSEKGIMPPIFDFDKATQTIRIIDSTFYFFLRNINPAGVLEQIQNPTEENH